MEKVPLPHPWPVFLLKFMLLAEGIMALIPGLLLIGDPSGKVIQFPEGALEQSPFANYLIPGFLLTLFMGVLPLFTCYALWKKPDNAFLQHINPFPKRHWAWTAALVCGSALVIWILVQITMVPYFFLQPALLSWGLITLLLCLLPKVKAFYQI